MARLLKGKRVMISVGEPWDFEYPAGAQGLAGHVGEIELPQDSSRQQVSVELQTPFVCEEGPRGTRLVASIRHVLPEGLVELLAAGERVAVNFSYADQVPEASRIANMYPGLIGSIRLAD
jgi:hypothetical protein